MMRWMLATTVGLSAALGAFLLVRATTPSVEVVLELPAAPAACTFAAEPEAPATFAEVIDLSDLSPLLDPLPRPVEGAPFEADAKATEMPADPAPVRIPPANE